MFMRLCTYSTYKSLYVQHVQKCINKNFDCKFVCAFQVNVCTYKIKPILVALHFHCMLSPAFQHIHQIQHHILLLVA